MEVNLSKLAYCKMVLHLAKYPHLSCNGLLLVKKSTQSPQKVNFVDAIPLFHTSISLAPAIETALWQIDAYCIENSLEIAGYYHANENSMDTKPSMNCFKIAEKLNENLKGTLVLMVNNQKLNPMKKEVPYEIYSFATDQRLKEANIAENTIEDGAFEACLKLLNARSFNHVQDFDNHLDNLLNNWRNESLNKMLQKGANLETIQAKSD